MRDEAKPPRLLRDMPLDALHWRLADALITRDWDAVEAFAVEVIERLREHPRPDLSKMHALADRWEHLLWQRAPAFFADALREALAEIEGKP